jgi:hypothetical protein
MCRWAANERRPHAPHSRAGSLTLQPWGALATAGRRYPVTRRMLSRSARGGKHGRPGHPQHALSERKEGERGRPGHPQHALSERKEGERGRPGHPHHALSERKEGEAWATRSPAACSLGAQRGGSVGDWRRRFVVLLARRARMPTENRGAVAAGPFGAAGLARRPPEAPTLPPRSFPRGSSFRPTARQTGALISISRPPEAPTLPPRSFPKRKLLPAHGTADRRTDIDQPSTGSAHATPSLLSQEEAPSGPRHGRQAH